MSLLLATTLLVLPTPASLGDGAPPSDWRARATAAADRLVVASVDASGNSIARRQLWYGAEGQQVLELLDGRACLARRSPSGGGLVCHFGGPAPIGAWPEGTALDDRGRSVNFARSERFFHLTTAVQGGETFLLAWRPRFLTSIAPAKVAPVVGLEQPVVAKPTEGSALDRLGWEGAGLAFLALLLVLMRGRRQGAVDRRQADAQWSARLAQEERRAAAAEARLDDFVEGQRTALMALAEGDVPDWGDLAIAAAADHLVEQTQNEVRRLDREMVALVSTMQRTECLGPVSDSTRWLLPLQQLSLLLAQLAGRLDSLGESALADQLRMRRAGMLRFAVGLERHLDESHRLTPEAWRSLWQATQGLVLRSAELSCRAGVRSDLPVLPTRPADGLAPVTPFVGRDESNRPELRRSQAV
jgi:hypothetical protein